MSDDESDYDGYVDLVEYEPKSTRSGRAIKTPAKYSEQCTETDSKKKKKRKRISERAEMFSDDEIAGEMEEDEDDDEEGLEIADLRSDNNITISHRQDNDTERRLCERLPMSTSATSHIISDSLSGERYLLYRSASDVTTLSDGYESSGQVHVFKISGPSNASVVNSLANSAINNSGNTKTTANETKDIANIRNNTSICSIAASKYKTNPANSTNSPLKNIQNISAHIHKM